MAGYPGMRKGRPSAQGMKRSKYGSTSCELDGMRFDSKLERSRWVQLSAMQQLGEISELRHHVDYPLMVAGKRLGAYEADFVYMRQGVEVIEDAKGVLTPLCRWKLKHMEAQGNPVELWPARKAKKRLAKAKAGA